MFRWNLNVPLIDKHPRQPIYVYCSSSVLEICSEVKGGDVGLVRAKKPPQTRQKLHLMAIRAKGKNIKQDVLVIHPFNEDLLYLIYDRHCAKHNEEYKDS